MTSKPKLEIEKITFGNTTYNRRECISECKKGYEESYNRCTKIEKDDVVDDDDVQIFASKKAEDLFETWWKILICCLIALVFSFIVLILFRYAIKYILWIICTAFVSLLAFSAALSWYGFFKSSEEEQNEFLLFAIVTTILVPAFTIVIYCYRNHIKLVAQLFKESSRALIDIPTIIFEPILTFISLMIAAVIFICFIFLIETVRYPVMQENVDGSHRVTFVNKGEYFYVHVINGIAFIWFTQFIFGCQHFVIGGKEIFLKIK